MRNPWFRAMRTSARDVSTYAGTRRWAAVLVVASLLWSASTAPASATDYGASMQPNVQPNEQRWVNRSTVARVFAPGTLGTWDSYPQLLRAYDAGIREFSISWKGTTGQEIRDFAATIPDGVKVYGTWYHEPENDIEKGELTLATWRKTMIRLCGVMRQNGIVPVRILMAWTLFPASKRHVRAYDLPKGTVAVSAFDGHVRDKDPRLVARLMLADKRRTGLPLAVPETSGPAARIRILRKCPDGKMRWGTYLTRDGMTTKQANAWFGKG